MVITNNVPRQILYWYELTDKQKSDLCHYDDIEDSSFFVYRGRAYDLNDFMRGGPTGWDGYRADSYFSALVVRLLHNGESVVVGLNLAD